MRREGYSKDYDSDVERHREENPDNRQMQEITLSDISARDDKII